MHVRSRFSHHYQRPDDDAVDQALVNATVVLDTNVLLSLYRVSPTLRQTRLDVFAAIGERLFFPYQGAVEFHRNRRHVVQDLRAEYLKLREAADTLAKVAKRFGGGDGRYDATTQAVQDIVNPLMTQLSDGVRALEEEDPHRVNLADDEVLSALEVLLEGRVGIAPRPKQLARRVREFVEIRVPLELPPGYRDAHKGSGPAAAAGDYLLWREVLDHARAHATDVVLVTEETKTDWWQNGAAGVPTVAHPLLVSEFQAETGRSYFQLSPKELLARAEKVLAIRVSEQDLVEEDELARVTAEDEGQDELETLRHMVLFPGRPVRDTIAWHQAGMAGIDTPKSAFALPGQVLPADLTAQQIATLRDIARQLGAFSPAARATRERAVANLLAAGVRDDRWDQRAEEALHRLQEFVEHYRSFAPSDHPSADPETNPNTEH